MQSLNPSQLEAYKLINLHLARSNGVILKAPAGFGKTYLLKVLIQHSKFKKILVIAETNNAVNILRDSLDVQQAIFKTICSALCYQLEHTESGYNLVQVSRPDWSSYDLVILDEGSQVPLLRIQEIQYHASKLLISGDDMQAPPIGEEISPAFTLPFPSVTLTIPMRNSTDVYAYSMAVRGLIGTNKLFPRTFDLTEKAFNSKVESSLDEFSEGTAVYLALSERGDKLKAVTDFNNLIKYKLFGDTENWHVSERIVFKGNYIPRDFKTGEEVPECPIRTNQLGTIVASEEHIIIWKNHPIRCLLLSFKAQGYVETFKGFIPLDLHERSYTQARVLAFASRDKKVKKEFFGLWLSIQPAYGVNVYVCQGLTIPKVFVDLKDITLCTSKSRLLRQKLFYVAVSRASKELTVKGY